MKMVEVMKAVLPKIEERLMEGSANRAGTEYTNMVGSMTEALISEASGEGLKTTELVAVCAALEVAHKIFLDIEKDDEDRLITKELAERVYSRTRMVAIRKEVEE